MCERERDRETETEREGTTLLIQFITDVRVGWGEMFPDEQPVLLSFPEQHSPRTPGQIRPAKINSKKKKKKGEKETKIVFDIARHTPVEINRPRAILCVSTQSVATRRDVCLHPLPEGVALPYLP